MAAALANVDDRDNWKVHFADTMRGGQYLNNWRMAELHAKEAPDRVRELEAWGARLRPHQGRPDPAAQLRRPPLSAPGPRRRPHRPRDDPHAAGPRHPPGHRRLHGVHGRRAAQGRRPRRRRASATTASAAASRVFKAKAVVLATGGIGRAFKITSQQLGVHRRRPRAGLRRRRRADGHGVRAVPPDRHGLAAAACAASWSPRACAARAACCATTRAGASCSTTSRTTTRARPPTTRRRAGATRRATRTRAARPSCYPRPRRALHHARGQGGPRQPARRRVPRHRLDQGEASRTRAEHIKKKLPSMYHQFKELADIDITKEPMEVGPTTHYMMGGVRVDGDTQMSTRARACSPPASAPPGCTAPTGSAATRCRTCSSSASAPASTRPSSRKEHGAGDDRRRRRSTRRRSAALAPFERDGGGEDPYQVQHDLQDDDAGPGRHRAQRGRDAAGARGPASAARSARRSVGVAGNREYNPGWHTALDLHNLLTVSEAITRAALERKESRGGHFRDDYPGEGRRSSASSTSSSRKGAGRRDAARDASRSPPMPRRARSRSSRRMK